MSGEELRKQKKRRESLKKREWERCVLWEISFVPIFFINVFLYVSKNYGVRYRTVQCHYIDFIVIVVNVMVKIRVIKGNKHCSYHTQCFLP